MKDLPQGGRGRRGREIPENVANDLSWGSDVAAEMLRRLDVEYIALNPGASYRGLHDSLVNFLGNERPEMLMVLHEEHAVAMAQGYAKVTDRPMAVALHSNVGLMHATMAIFNAWCDRQPMLMLGATGPVDAALRRPWIDWLHTSQDQAALIRNYIKYDDQPGSVEAFPEAILRAWQQAATRPCGPSYVCLDASLQEQRLETSVDIPDVSRFAPAKPPAADADLLAEAVAAIRAAKNPIILFGKGRVGQEEWDRRLALVARTGARVLTDTKPRAVFPSDHPNHVGNPYQMMHQSAREALRAADLIVSLGWVDLGGTLRMAFGADLPEARVIHAGQDLHLHNGWGKESFQLPAIDIHLLADADVVVRDLLEALPGDAAEPVTLPDLPVLQRPEGDRPLHLGDVAASLRHEAGETPVSFTGLCRGFPLEDWPFRDPLSYLGTDGGGGVGSGPGIAIGAALALRGSGRLPVAVLGDGDTLFSINSLWTAAKYEIPVLFVIGNNRSYYNDELHQEGVARTRGREMANRWVGQAIDGPVPDIATLARGQGVEAIGPVTTPDALNAAIEKGVAAVRAGQPFLIDVHIDPEHGRELKESMANRSLAEKA